MIELTQARRINVAAVSDSPRPWFVRAAQHLADVLRSSPAEFAEIFVVGFGIFSIGIWLLIPWRTFTEVAHYEALVAFIYALPFGDVLAPHAEALWGWLFAAAGIFQLAARALRRVGLRQWAVSTVSTVLGMTAGILLWSGSHAVVVLCLTHYALISVWVFWRLNDGRRVANE